MTKTNTEVVSAEPTRSRFQVLRDRIGPMATYVAIQVATGFLVLSVFWIGVLYFATEMVPSIMDMVWSSGKITADMSTDTKLVFWQAPSFVIIAFLFVALLALMKIVWRKRQRLMINAQSWLFGVEPEKVEAESAMTLTEVASGKARGKKRNKPDQA